jgi:hypothetical protein
MPHDTGSLRFTKGMLAIPLRHRHSPARASEYRTAGPYILAPSAGPVAELVGIEGGVVFIFRGQTGKTYAHSEPYRF